MWSRWIPSPLPAHKYVSKITQALTPLLAPINNERNATISISCLQRKGRTCVGRASPDVSIAIDPKAVFVYKQVELETKPGGSNHMARCHMERNIVPNSPQNYPETYHAGIGLFDITPHVRDAVKEAGIKEGFVNVISRHTTTALTINEMEPRLVDDVRQFLRKLAPPQVAQNHSISAAVIQSQHSAPCLNATPRYRLQEPYLHNDLHLRDAPEGWPGGWEAWAQQVMCTPMCKAVRMRLILSAR